MKWSEIASILYAVSQVKLLSSPEEWGLIAELFLERAKKDYD